MSAGTVSLALRDGILRLSAAGIVAPARDARILLAGALDTAPDRITLLEQDALAPDVAARFEAMITARARAQPVAQILGRRMFWGRMFRVSRDVLDPRPETETLVSLALGGAVPGSILDLGTGSGAILLTLLSEWPMAQGLGTDLSSGALAMARTNADDLKLADRANFTRSDWFECVTGRFDLVVCNPPYISTEQLAQLDADVRIWEPHSALTPGPTGLESYRHVAAGLALHLAPGGRALFEIGADQGMSVPAIFRHAGFASVAVHADLDGRPRVVSVGPVT